jgi:hypothetical protein
MTTTLAYYDTELITAVKRFYSTGPGSCKDFLKQNLKKKI